MTYIGVPPNCYDSVMSQSKFILTVQRAVGEVRNLVAFVDGYTTASAEKLVGVAVLSTK